MATTQEVFSDKANISCCNTLDFVYHAPVATLPGLLHALLGYFLPNFPALRRRAFWGC